MGRVRIASFVCAVVCVMFPRGCGGQLRRDVLEDLLPFAGNARVVIRTVRAIAPDLFKSTTEAIEAMGYPAETHHVTTEDGYRLALHRIPARGSKRGPPVLMHHGAFARGESFVAGGRGLAPGLTLADNGYDVWLANARGTPYSRKHEKYSTGNSAFWKFSFHEIGVYDLAAEIDYILNVTGHDKLFHIGHSMGTSAFYALMSMKPQYNDKIRLHASLGPAVFFNHSGSIVLESGSNPEVWQVAVAALTLLPTKEIQLATDAHVALMHMLLNDHSHFHKLGPLLMYLICGPMDLNNTTHFSSLLTKSMASTSAHVLQHFGELLQTGRFHQKSWGAQNNMRLYGSKTPPDYPLKRVTVPVALYSSEGDALTPARGTEKLSKVLPNVVSTKIIRGKMFNHIDYLWHKDVNELYVNHLLELMAKY